MSSFTVVPDALAEGSQHLGRAVGSLREVPELVAGALRQTAAVVTAPADAAALESAVRWSAALRELVEQGERLARALAAAAEGYAAAESAAGAAVRSAR